MASRGVNKVILIGNLGADPEMRYMPNGAAVTTLRIATSETWKDQAGEQKERTEWHRVVMYRKLGEIAAEYLKKGSKVYIEGSLRTQQWEKNGEKRYATDIVAHEMQMLDGKPAGENGQRREASQQQESPHGGVYDRTDAGGADFDDEVPF